MTKDLTIPKFGVLSFSSIYKRRETVVSTMSRPLSILNCRVLIGGFSPHCTAVLMYIWHARYDYITITICPPHSLNMYLVNLSHLICIQIIKKILIVNVCCVPQKLNVVNIWSCICYCTCLCVGTILFFPAYLSSIKIFLLLCQK